MTKQTFTLDDIVKVFPGEEGQKIRERFIAATAVQLTAEQLDGMDDVIHDRPTRAGLTALREFFATNQRVRAAAQIWLTERRAHNGLPSLLLEEASGTSRAVRRTTEPKSARQQRSGTVHLREKIVRFVAAHPGCTIKDIRDGVGLKSSSSVNAYTRTLVAEGALERTEQQTAQNAKRHHFAVVAGAR